MLEEGAEEGAQQAFDFFGNGGKLTTEDGGFDADSFKQLLAESGQAAALGALGGGIFHAGSQAVNAGLAKKITKKADKAYTNLVNNRAVDRLTNALENVQNGQRGTKDVTFTRMTKEMLNDVNAVRKAQGKNPLTKRKVTAFSNAINEHLGKHIQEYGSARNVAQAAFNVLTSEDTLALPGTPESKNTVLARANADRFADSVAVGDAETGETSLKDISPRSSREMRKLTQQKTALEGNPGSPLMGTSEGGVTQNRFVNSADSVTSLGDSRADSAADPSRVLDSIVPQNGQGVNLNNGLIGNINLNENINEETNIDPSKVRTTENGDMVKTNTDGTATRLSNAELANIADNNRAADTNTAQNTTQGVPVSRVNPFQDNAVNLRSGSDDINTLASRASQGDTYAQQRLAELTGQNQNEDTGWRGKSVDEVINPEGVDQNAEQESLLRALSNLWGEDTESNIDTTPKYDSRVADQKLMDVVEGKLSINDYVAEQRELMWQSFKNSNRGTETFYTRDSLTNQVNGRNTVSENGTLYRMLYEENGGKPTRANFNEAFDDVLKNSKNSRYYSAFKEFDPNGIYSAFGYNQGNEDIDIVTDLYQNLNNYVKETQNTANTKPLNVAEDGTPEFIDRYTTQTNLDGIDNSKSARQSRMKQFMESLKDSDNPIVKKFYELWHGDRKKSTIASLTAEEARRYTAESGVSIANDAKFVMTDNFVRHEDNDGHLTGIWRNPEPNTGIEVNANPLTATDIGMLDTLVKNPDSITNVGKVRDGQRLKIEKQIDNNYRIIADVVSDGKELNLVSYYKQNKNPLVGGLADLQGNPVSNAGVQVKPSDTRINTADRHLNNSISQNGGSVKQNKTPLDGVLPASQMGVPGTDGEVWANSPRSETTSLTQSIPEKVGNVNNESDIKEFPRSKSQRISLPGDQPRLDGTGTRSLDPSIAQNSENVKQNTNAGRSYESESEKLPDNFDVKHYITEQVKAQQKRSKVPLKERIADTTAELKHYVVDDAVAYERYIKDKNERLNIREGVDRVRTSDMQASQWMKDHGLTEIGKMPEKAKNGGKGMDEFQQYLIAKRAQELSERGIATGRSRAADQALIDYVGNKYAKEEAIIRQYTRDMLEYSAENGLISQKLKNDLIKENPNYVPMNRVFDVVENKTGFRSKQLGNLNKQTVVQKIKGSERVVDNPIESIMSNTMRMINEVERNKTAKLIATSEAFHEKKLADGEKPRPGYDTLNYMIDGEKVSYEVPELVAKEMKNLNSVLPDAAEAILKYVGAPTKLLRSGATGINPLFALSNLARDQGQTLITGSLKNNLKGTPKALMATFGWNQNAKDLRAELNRAGIIGSEYRQTYGTNSGDLVKQLQADSSFKKGAINKLRHPIDAIGDLIGKTEYFTRAQQYFGTDGDATTKAQAARNNTLNFSRAGAATRVLNRIIPFLNAGVQGGRATVNSFVQRPIHTTLALSSIMGVAALARGAAEAQNKELWDRIDDSDKQQNIILFTPDAHYDSDTNRVEGIIKIPVAQMTYPVMDFANNRKGDATDLITLAGDIFTATTGLESPNQENGLLPMVNQLTPTAVKPFVEAAINKSTYTGNDLVSEYDANKNPEDKGAKYTTGIARNIASVTGIDAPVIDNFIQNWGGGLAKDLSKTLSDNPDNKKDGGGIGKMFESGFNRRFLSGTVTSQYEIAEGLANNYKDEVKNSEMFKNLDSASQQKVLNAIDTDMNAIAGIATKVEQGREEDISNNLTARQTEITNNGFNADNYITAVTEKSAKYTNSGGSGNVSTLNGNVSNYGKSSTARTNSIEISNNLDNTDPLARSTLEKYNSMSSDEWNKYINGSSAESARAEYALAYAKYMNDLADDKLTDVEKIKREKEVWKLSISQQYEKKYRDAYGLASNKEDMQTYLNGLDGETRAATVDILNGLNSEMYRLGAISESTYKSRYRAINNIASSSRSGSRKKSSDGISSAEASAWASVAKTLASGSDGVKVKTPSAPTTNRKLSTSSGSGNDKTSLKTYNTSLAKTATVTKNAKKAIV